MANLIPKFPKSIETETMKRLKLLIIVFILALTLPLGYMVYSTHRSLEQEEIAELRYFAEALFDRMERELELLVLREEQRPVDDYTAGFNAVRDALDREPYIVGYIQNNPDGSLLSPSVPPGNAPLDIRAGQAAFDELKTVNDLFNQLRSQKKENRTVSGSDGSLEDLLPETVQMKAPPYSPSVFSNRYYQAPLAGKQKSYLGREEKRVERITRDQALNVAQKERPAPSLPMKAFDLSEESPALEMDRRAAIGRNRLSERTAGSRVTAGGAGAASEAVAGRGFHMEVDPLQSVIVNDRSIFIFRRIVIDNQVFRQGFAVDILKLLNHLSEAYFKNQPMARFAELYLWVADRNRVKAEIRSGRHSQQAGFSLVRTFPRPFSFLQARLATDRIPPSEGRQTLNIMVIVLAAVILIGLFAIYHSARVVVDLSERRTGFVSSVTHELKTPLTNIRLYIEMLENGIAVDSEREQEYYRILGSETSRLSRLINNVLEFSKLEKKQRRLELKSGDLTDVLAEVEDVMREKLRQDGFSLEIKHRPGSCRYDREAMVQVLINLLENSVKFGGETSERRILLSVVPQKDKVAVRVSDTGPGIPRGSLKKVFDDFYRVDNSLTRRTKGTGIGLALVKKLVTDMGGTVSAANNPDRGCTITISLPKGDA